MKVSHGYVILGQYIKFNNVYQTLRYGYPHAEICRVEIYEDENGEFWGYWDFELGRFQYLHNLVSGIQIGLAYHINTYEELGKGKLMKVSIKKL